MEKVDQQLLTKVASINPTVRSLYAQHRKLERRVASFELYAKYSSSAALKHQELKKQKLRGMDTIMSILREYKAD